jgi:hypothetical protein
MYLIQVEVRNGVAMVLVMIYIPMVLMEQAFGWVRTCSVYIMKHYTALSLDFDKSMSCT